MQNFSKKTLDFLKNHYGIILVIFIAILCYIGIFGIISLDIFNSNFVLRDFDGDSYFSTEDINTHYLGSIFYRLDNFHLKIFFSEYLAYPFGTSILNTDSIPLLAFIFKILYKFFGLSPYTQYFGIYILLCFILQGIFGFKIAKLLNLNTINSVIASVFLVLSPIMITRAFEHTALSAHFFILAAIYLYLINYKPYKHEIYWTILFMGMFVTQPNFFPILFALFIADYCKKIFVTKQANVRLFLIFIITLIAINYLFITRTGLLIGNTLKGSGYGFYSANLNFLINPSNWSLFFQGMKLGTGGQYEGICYLGLGIIILFILSIFLYPKINRKPSFKNNAPLIVALSILMIYALTNKIYFNNILILSYPLPPELKNIFNIFRTSARMTWIVWYMIFFFSIFVLNNKFKAKWLTLLLLTSLCIQITDLSPIFRKKYIETQFFSKREFKTILKSEKWDNEYKNYNGIFTINSTYEWLFKYKYFWYWCIQNNKTINYGYFSRYPKEAKNLQKKYRREIKKGNIPDSGLIYVFSEKFYKELADLAKKDDNVKKIVSKTIFTDGFYIYAD